MLEPKLRNPRKTLVYATTKMVAEIRKCSGIETKASIARRLGISERSVYRVQQREGLPHFDRQSGRSWALAQKKLQAVQASGEQK